MKLTRVYGNTSEILNIFVRDATNSSGAGLANVLISTFSTYWCRNDQTSTSSVTLVSTAALGTYTSGGWTQINSTFMMGWYQFGIPDGVFASGRSAAIHLYGNPSMAPTPIEIELSAKDNQKYVSSEVFSSTQVVATLTNLVGVSSVQDKGGYGVSSFNGNISSNVMQINSVPVIGSGTAGDLWRA